VPQWPTAVDSDADILRQQALYRLGEQAERYGDIDVAEHIYGHAEGWPSSERLARLAYARGERDNVAAMLSEMLDSPACEEELLFAQDFQARKYGRKRTALITDLLRSGPERGIDESYRDIPEEGVANWYRARGARVYYSENRLWRRLFGVIFWEMLFNRENAALHNDFEKRPRDLDNGTFYRRHEADIEQVLQSFDDVHGLHRRLLNTVAREYGKANSIFRWAPDILDMLRDCLFALPTRGLAEMMRRMAQDFRGNCSGYPDLLVIENSSARFVEVKAEGDQLRRNQLKQITALERAGIPVAVDRIKWSLDPDQSYVVVDIETTGRRGGSNRITEIGAVRMRGDKIIDTWHHLINPGRSIPASITRLTGIEDSMLVNAPRFAEIADSLSQYSEGCIFVAHNARFDYGFICDEFRRLDQSFHRPTYCTVSGMRRWYPGLPSYSLGNLCRELDISLEQHHRALCDARAAAELLVLINKRRAAN
jgi:DNA polymerase-3 subunit epsilon